MISMQKDDFCAYTSLTVLRMCSCQVLGLMQTIDKVLGTYRRKCI